MPPIAAVRVPGRCAGGAAGLDTFEGDPISGFHLKSADYLRRCALRSLALPTVFCFEGGYAVAEVGVNAVNVLGGLRAPESAAGSVHALGAAHQRHEAVVDVAARKRHADACWRSARGAASARPARRRPRLEHQLQTLEGEAHRLHHHQVGRREHVLHVGLDDLEGCCPPPASAGRRRWCAARRC